MDLGEWAVTVGEQSSLVGCNPQLATEVRLLNLSEEQCGQPNTMVVFNVELSQESRTE
jgi:hypothetical protein